jgi:type IV pilus assembly protein PilM
MIDYLVLDGGGAVPRDTMDVLLVAAKREKINDYTGVITRAGRTAVVMDVDVFALQNVYEANYGIEPGAVVALLNAGASAINVNILKGDTPVFTRDISVGGNAYTEALQKELNVSYETADAIKRGEPVDGVRTEDVEPVLRTVTETVLFEIQKTFDFFKATTTAERIDRIMLSGGTSRVSGFVTALQDRFEVTVELLDPFRKIAFDGAKLGVDPAEVAPTAAVAVGLALRRAGDR